MAQHDYVIANGTGAAVRSDLNAGFAAIVSQNSGATAPSTTYAYQSWADTSAGVMKMRNGANNAWISLYQLDGEWSTIAFENGTAAAPSIYFKDSGTDTGIYSPGADQVAISTGGTSRLAVSTTAVSSTLAVDVPLGAVGTPSLTFTGDLNTGIYSPGADQVGISTGGTVRITVDGSGNVNIDSNTLYVDAANNRVGIGTSSPNSTLDVRGIVNLGDPSVTGSTRKHFVFTGGAITSDTTNGLTLKSGSSSTTDQFVRFETGGGTLVGAIGNVGDGLSVWTRDTSNALTVTQAGRLGIGTTSPGYQLELSTDSAGKPSSALWTIVSDERIKEDIELADLDLCYEAIKAIPLKRYKWRDEIYTGEQVSDRRKLGWIAQDVEAIFPKAVGTHEFKYNQVFEETIIPAVEEELDADGNVITPAQPQRIEQGDLISEHVIEDCRDLNSDQLYAAMYGAVQKLMAKVETLEASNADMLARLAALEGA